MFLRISVMISCVIIVQAIPELLADEPATPPPPQRDSLERRPFGPGGTGHRALTTRRDPSNEPPPGLPGRGTAPPVRTIPSLIDPAETKRRQEERKAQLEKEQAKYLAVFDERVREYKKKAKENKSAEEFTSKRTAMGEALRDTLARLLRVQWQEHRADQRPIQDVLQTCDELLRVELELSATKSAKIGVRQKHLERLKALETDLQERAASGDASEADVLAGTAARQRAANALHVEVSGQSPPIEQLLLERRTEGLNQLYQKAAALRMIGARGGETEKVTQLGYQLHQAQADLALARGDSQVALDELRRAAIFSDQAVDACTAAYNQGTTNLECVIQSYLNRQECFLSYVRLERSLQGDAVTTAPGDE